MGGRAGQSGSWSIPEEEYKLLTAKFEEVIIEQAVYLGWRIYQSSVVLKRIASWIDDEPDGMRKLERFNQAIIRHATVKRGTARLPFTESEWHQSRKNALEEIKALRRKLTSQFALRGQEPNLDQANSAISSEITAHPRAFQYLSENLSSLMDYLSKQGELSAAFVAGQVTPGVLIDGWFDYQGSTPDEKSRQFISRTRKKKH